MPGKKSASNLAATVCWHAQNEARASADEPSPDVSAGAQAVMMLTLQAVLNAHEAGELELDGVSPADLLESLDKHFSETSAPAPPSKGLLSKAVAVVKKLAGSDSDSDKDSYASDEEPKPSAKKAGRPPASAKPAPAKSAVAKAPAKPITPKPVSAAKPAAKSAVKPVSAAKPAAKAGGDGPKKPGRPPKAA